MTPWDSEVMRRPQARRPSLAVNVVDDESAFSNKRSWMLRPTTRNPWSTEVSGHSGSLSIALVPTQPHVHLASYMSSR
jgi:hypothetical protein